MLRETRLEVESGGFQLGEMWKANILGERSCYFPRNSPSYSSHPTTHFFFKRRAQRLEFLSSTLR